MKNNIFRQSSLFRIPFFWGLILVASSCTPDDFLNEITSDSEINFNTDIFHIPLVVQFLDANPDVGPIEKGLNLTINGKDKDLIYSSIGKRALEVNDGFLEIAVDKQEEISPDNPLELTLVVEAPGYRPVRQRVTINDMNFNYQPIYMINTDALPPGADGIETEFMLSPAGATREMAFSTPFSGGKTEGVTVKVPAGTKMMNAQGESVSGQMNISLVHYDARQESTVKALPGGLIQSNVLDRNGGRLGSVQFVPAGFFSLDMYRRSREVSRFSQPIAIEMGIDRETIHANTGKKIQVGDNIPFWSRSDETGQWQQEGQATVGRDTSGNLVAQFQITHLSDWSVAFYFLSECLAQNPMSFTIQSLGANQEADLTLPVQFVDNQSGLPIGPLKMIKLVEDHTFNLSSIPGARDITMQILPTGPRTGGCIPLSDPIFQTAITSNCNTSTNINLNGMTLSDQTIADIEIFGTCNGSEDEIRVYPAVQMFFRPTLCGGEYNFLGSGPRGSLTTAGLQLGVAYDFQATIGGESFSVEDVMIAEEVLEKSNARITIQVVEGRLKITIDQVEIPAKYCKEIIG